MNHFVLKENLKEQSASFSNIYVNELTPLVIDFLKSNSDEDVQIDKVADHFCMSVRTFQRKLALEGTSYRKIYDDYRKIKAIDLLKTGRFRVLDIAMHLGFDEPSSFIKAFRRWTGTVPSKYKVAL